MRVQDSTNSFRFCFTTEVIGLRELKTTHKHLDYTYATRAKNAMLEVLDFESVAFRDRTAVITAKCS